MNYDLIFEHWVNECAYFEYYEYIFLLFQLYILSEYLIITRFNIISILKILTYCC